jgi:two-component system sensor histidine kinase and response regulator WspE
MTHADLANASLLDLFRLEAEEQARVLTAGLLALERNPFAADSLEACMRAAHSLKGAARIINLAAGVNIAHTMESCFVAAQECRTRLQQPQIDDLLRAVDLLRRIAQTPESALDFWHPGAPDVEACEKALNRILETQRPAELSAVATQPPHVDESSDTGAAQPPTRADRPISPVANDPDRVLRVTAENLDQLLNLAGESLVASRRLRPFVDSLLRLKRQHSQISSSLQQLREALPGEMLGARAHSALATLEARTLDTRRDLDQRLAELDTFDRRAASLSRRMYDSAAACRMRPFADGVHGFPRMVRDLGRTLAKEVRIEIVGAQTQVDRDVLEKLDAPLGHLLRNAVDHGIEPPELRRKAGKPAVGIIRLEARHIAGRLLVVVSDDGAGIDLQKLRTVLISRGLTTAETAAQLSEPELFAFLLLPGFSLASNVTDISGRGVGLDAVQDVLKRLRGTLRISSKAGAGTQFQMHLPLTLSIVRALIVEVSGEAYAMPLAAILRTVHVAKTQIAFLEGKPHFELDGARIGLIGMHQILESAPPAVERTEWLVILLAAEGHTYGLAVDRLVGERELVIRPLDSRLGKVRNISAAALMEDGSAVLIVDTEDLVRSAANLVALGTLGNVSDAIPPGTGNRQKRILIVEDSLTVRELERKLLASGGYEVEVAVDGMDGWNAVRSGNFDLVLTDVDMPRMDGIELVTLIKQDARMKSLPVMIVSYKDRPEDRNRGLQAGADYYLAKGSFHDQKLLSAVADLIGGASA